MSEEYTLNKKQVKTNLQDELRQLKAKRTEKNKEIKNISNADAKAVLVKDLLQINEQITEITAKLTALQEAIEQEKKDKKALEKANSKSGIDDASYEEVMNTMSAIQSWLPKIPSMAWIIQDQNFVFIDEYADSKEKQNVQVITHDMTKFKDYVANRLGVQYKTLMPSLIKELFNHSGRTYDLSRYSIDDKMWRQSNVYLPIKFMEKYFIDKMEVDEEPYSPFFDTLIHSLSGGKAENKEHIERWIVHKVINYRKAVTTPDIIIVGHVGGNGKGIIQAIIRLMMPAALSGKANTKTLNGNFNAIMMGKLVVFFDDQNSREIPLEVVKQLAGSETMIFEPKGKDQYEGEKTHSSAWFSNKLPFKLTPGGQEGGVDRRFSVMSTNITFLESIREYYKEVHNQDMTVEESKDIAEMIVRDILLNRLHIARWFMALRRRYPEINENYTLKPLHGQDYQYFLKLQKTAMESIWDLLVIPQIKSGGCVPIFVIKELIRHIDGKQLGSKSNLERKITELANTTKMDVITERTRIDIYPSKYSKPKQCTVIRPKDKNEWLEKSFNWSLVSSKDFIDATGANGELISEEDLVFGQVRMIEDDMPEAVAAGIDFEDILNKKNKKNSED
jgi:hypothetical protein